VACVCFFSIPLSLSLSLSHFAFFFLSFFSIFTFSFFPVCGSFCFSCFLFLPDMLINLFFLMVFPLGFISCHQPVCFTNGCVHELCTLLVMLLHERDTKTGGWSVSRTKTEFLWHLDLSLFKPCTYVNRCSFAPPFFPSRNEALSLALITLSLYLVKRIHKWCIFLQGLHQIHE